MWIYHAFGPFWGFQEGYWSWISGVVISASYPALAISTFTTYYGNISWPVVNYAAKIIVSVVFALPNLYGIKIVDWGMTALTIAVTIPFLVSIWVEKKLFSYITHLWCRYFPFGAICVQTIGLQFYNLGMRTQVLLTIITLMIQGKLL